MAPGAPRDGTSGPLSQVTGGRSWFFTHSTLVPLFYHASVTDAVWPFSSQSAACLLPLGVD